MCCLFAGSTNIFLTLFKLKGSVASEEERALLSDCSALLQKKKEQYWRIVPRCFRRRKSNTVGLLRVASEEERAILSDCSPAPPPFLPVWIRRSLGGGRGSQPSPACPPFAASCPFLQMWHLHFPPLYWCYDPNNKFWCPALHTCTALARTEKK